MKKVGIVTLYYKNYNFGGLLQAYALPKIIRKQFKIDAEQISFSLCAVDDGAVNNMYIKKNNVIYQMAIKIFAQIEKRNITTRKRKFEQFMREIPHCEEVYDVHTIQECLSKYQVFICGGDQIWNIRNGVDNLKVFTLRFAPENVRKIAYAPSMAVLEMDSEGKECMEQGLSGLKAISVREKQSIELLKKVTNKKIEIVVDPVLLLNEEEWSKELREPILSKKYILCYLINDNVAQRKAIQKLAKKLQLQIVTFPHILANAVRKCDLFFGDIHDYTSGPREFLGLIKNAEFVITDSFHACVFSMIFQTPFVVLERDRAGVRGNMNSRIYDFTEEYHLEKQLVTAEMIITMDKIPKIDFSFAYAHWKKRREESLEYLANALKDN